MESDAPSWREQVIGHGDISLNFAKISLMDLQDYNSHSHRTPASPFDRSSEAGFGWRISLIRHDSGRDPGKRLIVQSNQLELLPIRGK